MVLTDKIDIAAPPERVWTLLCDQDRFREWNFGVRAIVPISSGRWAANSCFRMRYLFAGSEGNFLCEILEFEEPVKIVIHLKGGNLPLGGYIQEIYELSASTKGTLLKRSVAVHKSGKNFLAGALLFLLHYLSRRRRTHLVKLRELAESYV